MAVVRFVMAVIGVTGLGAGNDDSDDDVTRLRR
jgi:hypothetical protein